MTIVVFIAVVLVILVAVAWYLKRKGQPRIGEIAPAHVLQRKYGLYAENRPEIKLDPAKVPEHLRHLIPMAEKWGIGDDIIRDDFEEKSSDDEKKELRDALYEPYERITEWLDSCDGKDMSEEAAAFMYMQLALDEMGIYILREQEQEKMGTQPDGATDPDETRS